MNAITPSEPMAADGQTRQGWTGDMIVSYEPATGVELWRGRISDIDRAVKTVRRAFPPSAAQPLSARMELVRRVANEVHKDFDKLAETIARKVAARPDKLLTLEMGGNNPIVVWDTPKITDADALIVQSAFASAGQRCTAACRLIVKDSMYDAVMAEVKALADRIIFGAPFDEPSPLMGPIIDNHAADGLTESFFYLLSNSGKAIKHLVRPDESKPFLLPAIINMTAMKDRPDVELFGPILQVIQVSDLNQAISEANDTRFGLVAAMIGGQPQDYNRFWANVRAGIVSWNRPTISPSHAAPIGGIGLSGNHRPYGHYAADYCAYPVASEEAEQQCTAIGIGLK